MDVEPGKLVELQADSGSWYVRCLWCEEYVHFCPGSAASGAEAKKHLRERLSWRLSNPGSAMRKRNWSCPECAKGYEWESPKVSVPITPGSGASSHVAPPAHAIEGGPLAGHPASGGESSSPPAAVIDELKAEVERLTGEVTKLRAEVDELKVRDGGGHQADLARYANPCPSPDEWWVQAYYDNR